MNQTSRFFFFVLVLFGFTILQAEAQPKSALRLAGAWQSDNKLNTVTFSSDGSGKNADGSRFRWRLEKGALVFRAISREGKVGPDSRIPIEFTRDGREYALLFEGGKLRSVFHRLTTAGRRYANRTKRGRQYLGSKNSAKSDADDVQAIPSGAKPKKGNDTDSESNEHDSGQHQVGRNVQVSKAYAAIEHSEVVIVADPANANRLLAASMFSPPPIDHAAPKMVVYASEDGGKTWVLSFERKDKNPRSFADPAFAFCSDGTAYFANMFWEDFAEEKGRRLQFVRRQSGSQAWEKAGTIEGWHDRPFLTVDNTDTKYQGRLYCLAMSGLFVSADNGASFPFATTITPRSGYGYTGSGNPVVLSDGRLITLHNAYRQKNGGNPKPEAPESGYLSVRTSKDGGETVSVEQIVARYNFDRLDYSNVPVMASDTSGGKWKDRLYVVWNDSLTTGGTGVFLTRSEDKGATWSRPTLLSEQSSPAKTLKGVEGKYASFLPSVSVNKDGVVGVSWYDTRGLPSEKAGWNLRFRSSLDGGETWQPSVCVSEKTTLFALKKRTKPSLKEQRAAYHLGHTSGLCTDANGAFHTLWIDSRTGSRQVWTATIVVQSAK